MNGTKLPLESMRTLDAATKRFSSSSTSFAGTTSTTRGLQYLYPSFHVASSSPTSDASSSSYYSPSSSPNCSNSMKVNKRKPLFVRRVITSEFKEQYLIMHDDNPRMLLFRFILSFTVPLRIMESDGGKIYD
jgi:hypothetical protein